MKWLLAFMILTGCAVVPITLEDLAKSSNVSGNSTDTDNSGNLNNFEYFKISIKFAVPRDSAMNDPANPAFTEDFARRITVAEKRHILRILDDIKFTMNTPEYEEVFLTLPNKPVSGVTMMGFDATSTPGTVLDRRKMLDAMRNAEFELTFNKKYIQNALTAARTSLGVDIPVGWAYVSAYPYLDYAHSRMKNAIAGHSYQNRTLWNTVSHMTVHHEYAHNIGFDHSDYGFLQEGKTIDYIVKVWTRTFESGDFQAKYRTKIQDFRGYHERKYAHFLAGDTVMSGFE